MSARKIQNLAGYVFFVAKTQDVFTGFTASFRLDGMRPELWDAENGSMSFAPVWRQKDGRTEVDLQLERQRSVFVIFRDAKQPADHLVSATPAIRIGRTGDTGIAKCCSIDVGETQGLRAFSLTIQAKKL